MKYNIFLLLVFYYPIILFSQQNQSIGNKGVKDGFGVLEYKGHGVYRGNFVNSKIEGYGEYFFNNGDVIKGNKKNGLYEGVVTYYFSNGDVKTANYIEGKEVSVISYSNASEKKVGCVSGDCQNGIGKYIYTNGEYEGSFLYGKQTGQGKLTLPNGDSYEGQFSNGIKNGYGVFIQANGKKYEGNYKNGQKSGIGTFYDLDGNKYIGNWTEGQKNGMGEIYYSDGSYYVGEFVNGSRTGNGKVVFADGQIQEGLFENDIYKGVSTSNTVTQNTIVSPPPVDKNQVSIKNELLDKNKVVDADGNVYNTVRIRDKIWITENLKTKHYNDGQSIQQVEDHRIWAQLITPAFCDPPSDFGYANDGLLYNHYVVERGNVCPKGFKVPTATVIDSLLNYYDGYDLGYLLGGFWRNYYDKTADFDDVASGKVKESLTLSGFNFLDGATRDYSFDDQDLDKGYSKYYQGFWLRDRKTKFDDEKYSSVVQLEWSEYRFSQSVRIEQTDIRSGNYIRCYKEYIPTISDDKIMTVKDKDDNLHKVVRIGNQIWMAEDLKTVPENTRVVFNNEELEHYSKTTATVVYDNFKSSGPVNYNYFNLTYYLEDANFKDVCPQNWHLPDQGEWEIMIRNSNLKDIKSTTGWQIYKKPGYNETRRVECSNCKSGSQKYKDNCNVCNGNGFKIINTGKYIPEQITNYNGTNKSGMNIRPYPTYEYGKFDNNYYNSEVYYLVKDHRAKGVTLITFRLKDIEFDKCPDLDTRAHIRCVKD